jgi:anti-sigma B factor antagonist
MSCTITARERGDVTVLDSHGRISLGEGASSLRDVIEALAAKGRTKIIINFADTSYVDSSGIGELVSGFTRIANQGGQIKLLSLTKRVKDLLVGTRLYTVFEVFENEDDAVSSFK